MHYSNEKKLVEICRIAYEVPAGGLATLRVVHDSHCFNLVLCEKNSKSILGKFSTLDVAMSEAAKFLKKEGLDQTQDPVLH